MRALMIELVKLLRTAVPPDNLAKLMHAHAPTASHCPACRTVWPCTIWAAAAAASRRPDDVEPAA